MENKGFPAVFVVVCWCRPFERRVNYEPAQVPNVWCLEVYLDVPLEVRING